MRSNRLKDAIAKIFDPRAAVPFFIGAIIVGIMSNAFFQLLLNSLGTGSMIRFRWDGGLIRPSLAL